MGALTGIIALHPQLLGESLFFSFLPVFPTELMAIYGQPWVTPQAAFLLCPDREKKRVIKRKKDIVFNSSVWY